MTDKRVDVEALALLLEDYRVPRRIRDEIRALGAERDAANALLLRVRTYADLQQPTTDDIAAHLRAAGLLEEGA